MANTGAPVSNGSQFFVVYKNSTLAPSYTPFGTIVSGLNIIQKVGSRRLRSATQPSGRWQAEGERRHRERDHQENLTGAAPPVRC